MDSPAPDIDVRRLSIRPGDMVVLEIAAEISANKRDLISIHVREALVLAGHADVQVLVLSDRVRLTVVSRTRALQVMDGMPEMAPGALSPEAVGQSAQHG